MPALHIFRIYGPDGAKGWRCLCEHHALEVRRAGFTLVYQVKACPPDSCDACDGLPVHDIL